MNYLHFESLLIDIFIPTFKQLLMSSSSSMLPTKRIRQSLSDLYTGICCYCLKIHMKNSLGHHIVKAVVLHYPVIFSCQ